MSKATQCAEALMDFTNGLTSPEQLAEIILRFYPEEETTITFYQNPEPTNSLRMIDEGRDV